MPSWSTPLPEQRSSLSGDGPHGMARCQGLCGCEPRLIKPILRASVTSTEVRRTDGRSVLDEVGGALADTLN